MSKLSTFAMVGTLVVSTSVLAEALYVCCSPAYELLPPTGTSGGACTGNSVASCEKSPQTVQDGKTWAGSTRKAKCTTHENLGSVLLQAPCDSVLSGYQKVPGTLASGQCCFIVQNGSTTVVTNRDFDITPCSDGNCKSPRQ